MLVAAWATAVGSAVCVAVGVVVGRGVFVDVAVGAGREKVRCIVPALNVFWPVPSRILDVSTLT